MKKIFERKNSEFQDDRNNIIKQSLLYNLSENVKEVQFEFKQNEEKCLGISEITNSFISTLEAIFLHGLKDTFLQFTMNIISTAEVENKPNPNFWPLIILFLHKNIIEEICSHAQLTTDVGYARAFIRQALNETLLSSYLSNIRKNSNCLKYYYNKYAFLFDPDLVETSEKVLQGIENYVLFKLPCNSSLLNFWTDVPLQMAGIWSPPLRTIPVASGIDVASSLSNEVPTGSASINIPKNLLSMDDIYTNSITNSIFLCNSPTFFEADSDDKFKKILECESDEESESLEVSEMVEKMQDSIEKYEENKSIEKSSETEEIKESSPQASSSSMSGSSKEKLENSPEKEIQPECSPNNNQEQVEDQKILYKHSVGSVRPSDKFSYRTVWNQVEKNRNSSNFKEVWLRFEKSLQLNRQPSEDPDDTTNDFVMLDKPVSDKISMAELPQMIEILCKLSTEAGLPAQGFLCKECNSPLGIDFSKAQVCAFDGKYYCNACISPDKYQIPARIIYNWDFSTYTVSNKAASFLSEFAIYPFIDFKILNPDIYTYIDEMSRLQRLRIQLNFIRAYIFTCSESIINELQKKLYTKEYLYDTIHQYSIYDLMLINNGSLEELLKKIVCFGKSHVEKCALCSLKGFICEVCRKPKIIYPFDIDNTHRCNKCGSVFHINCFNSNVPCPKCDRRQAREALLLLEESISGDN